MIIQFRFISGLPLEDSFVTEGLNVDKIRIISAFQSRHHRSTRSYSSCK